MNAKAGVKSALTRSVAPTLAMLLLAASPSRAASVSYFLDQANSLPDGTPYVQVTIADGADGAIDFTVEVLGTLTAKAGGNVGFQSFAFNVTADGFDSGSIGNLPDGWSAHDDTHMSQFGFFDVSVSGPGNERVAPLTFSILGIDGDTPDDYASFFATHLAGFKLDCARGSRCPDSAFIGGNAPIPLPGAAWLFVTGAAAVAARARKRGRGFSPDGGSGFSRDRG